MNRIHNTLYLIANLFVIPAVLIPNFEAFVNIFSAIAMVSYFSNNLFYLSFFFITLLLKSNTSYRFSLLVKTKGEKISRSDPVCVFLFAWLTFLRYLLIVLGIRGLFVLF